MMGPPSEACVLLVDDNATKRLALKSLLAPLGYAIEEADSGRNALRCLMVKDFAAILLDVHMPGMDGFETAAVIRQRKQSELTPIIFITAYADDEIAPAARFVEGAVDFIFAPVNPVELRAKVSVFANQFINARRLAVEAQVVQASVDQLTLLTDAAPIGIFRTDGANKYVYTNPRWSEITGISRESAKGRVWDSIIEPGQRLTTVVDSANPADTSEITHRFEVRIPGARTRTVQVTSRPIATGQEGVAGWVGTMSDVSAESWAELALSDARDKADEASRLKSDFLTNMSHEIRTPLNGVIGMADLLLETQLDTQQRDYAETVRNSAEALLVILNDVLDFSKIEAGGLSIENIEFNLPTIVHGMVSLLSGLAQAKGLLLNAVIDELVPTLVRGDPGRLRQILTNLVGNAIKFTPHGNVDVRVSCEERDASRNLLRFEVIDTGVGVPNDKLGMIFEPFVQADTSISRKFGGTGLGLAICARMVTLMGGQCGVSSQLGIGSTFWFTVPVCVPAGQRAKFDEGGAAGVLLLAEDNLINQKVAVAMLSGAGYIVDTAVNGAAAAEAAATHLYDAILMDCQMPELDGYEATAIIRAHEGAYRHTPIIAMTAGTRQEDQARCLQEGMDDFVSKPVSRDALLEVVGRHVGARGPVSAQPAC